MRGVWRVWVRTWDSGLWFCVRIGTAPGQLVRGERGRLTQFDKLLSLSLSFRL